MPPDRHFSRAKAGNACVACRSAKQRCDGGGQADVQCRRCEIYGLDCFYQTPTADGSDIDKRLRPPRSKESAPPEVAPAAPAPAPAPYAHPSQVSTPAQQPAASTSSHQQQHQHQSGPKPHAHNPISERLEEINTRLMRIEGVMSGHGTVMPPGLSPAHSDASLDSKAPLSATFKARHTDNRGMDAMAPIKMIGQVVHRQDPNDANSVGSGGTAAVYRQKDCIDLGIVSDAQAAALLDFFMLYMNPWNMLVESNTSPALVRHSNPMLFIAMIVCAGYYCLPVETEAGAVTLAQLTDIYYRNLGALNVAPSATDLNEQTVTALLMGFLWKPLRFIDQDLSKGITEACQQKGKFNLDSSYLLWPMLHKIVSAAGLQESPLIYASNAANSGATHRTRIFFYFTWVEMLVALVQGRNMTVDPTEGCNVTRLFASRAESPSDFSLGAMMELCLLVYTWQKNSEGDRAQQLHALQTFSQEHNRWNNYWLPLLRDRERLNRLALLETMASFALLCACSITFQRLTAHKKGAECLRAELDSEERGVLQQANDTAHDLMYYFSLEHRSGPMEQTWFADASGSMPDLTIDQDKLAAAKYAPDNAFAIVAFSAPMLLVGWINQKLITSNGEVCDTEEKADTCFYVNRKTWRLLDFMAKVLAWVAPKPGHPTAKQSRILQELIQLAHRTSFPNSAQPSMGPSVNSSPMSSSYHVGVPNGMQGMPTGSGPNHPSTTLPSMTMPSLEAAQHSNNGMGGPPQQPMIDPTESVDWGALFKDEFIPPSWQEMGGVQFPFSVM